MATPIFEGHHPPPRRRRSRSLQRRPYRRWTVLAVLGAALLSLPLILLANPNERARWRAASALELHLNGERDLAIDRLEAVVVSYPDPTLLRTLVQWLSDSGRTEESLQWCDRWEERTSVTVDSLKARRYALTASGQYAEALQLHLQVRDRFDESQLNTLSHRNQLAYYQALAGVDLDEAAALINQVITYVDHFTTMAEGLELPTRLRLTLYAAQLFEQAKQYQTALDLVTNEIHVLYGEFEESNLAFGELFSWHLRHRTFARSRSLQELSRMRQVHQRNTDALAALLSIRALLHQRLGNLSESILDRRRVEWLGYDPETTIANLPSVQEVAERAAELAMYLDTRGCVYFAQDKMEEALADFDVAIAACESLLALPWQARIPKQVMVTDSRMLRYTFDEQIRKALATILYHRMRYYESTEDQHQVANHIQRIHDLGFVPSPALF